MVCRLLEQDEQIGNPQLTEHIINETRRKDMAFVAFFTFKKGPYIARVKKADLEPLKLNNTETELYFAKAKQKLARRGGSFSKPEWSKFERMIKNVVSTLEKNRALQEEQDRQDREAAEAEAQREEEELNSLTSSQEEIETRAAKKAEREQEEAARVEKARGPDFESLQIAPGARFGAPVKHKAVASKSKESITSGMTIEYYRPIDTVSIDAEPMSTKVMEVQRTREADIVSAACSASCTTEDEDSEGALLVLQNGGHVSLDTHVKIISDTKGRQLREGRRGGRGTFKLLREFKLVKGKKSGITSDAESSRKQLTASLRSIVSRPGFQQFGSMIQPQYRAKRSLKRGAPGECRSVAPPNPLPAPPPPTATAPAPPKKSRKVEQEVT